MIAAIVFSALLCLQGIAAFPHRPKHTKGVSMAQSDKNNPLVWGATEGLHEGHAGLDGGYSAGDNEGSYADAVGYAGGYGGGYDDGYGGGYGGGYDDGYGGGYGGGYGDGYGGGYGGHAPARFDPMRFSNPGGYGINAGSIPQFNGLGNRALNRYVLTSMGKYPKSIE